MTAVEESEGKSHHFICVLEGHLVASIKREHEV